MCFKADPVINAIKGEADIHVMYSVFFKEGEKKEV
jgi:hypothetical protein